MKLRRFAFWTGVAGVGVLGNAAAAGWSNRFPTGGVARLHALVYGTAKTGSVTN